MRQLQRHDAGQHAGVEVLQEHEDAGDDHLVVKRADEDPDVGQQGHGDDETAGENRKVRGNLMGPNLETGYLDPMMVECCVITKG